MPSRFPFRLFLVGAAGLAVMLLIPAEPGDPSITGLAIGDAAPAPAGAAAPPIGAGAPPSVAPPGLVAGTPVPDRSAPVAAPQAAPALASIDPIDVLPAQEAPAAERQDAWVSGAAVNVRAGPSASTARLFVLERGVKVAIIERSGDWAFVADRSGESGWVYARYLADSPTAALARAPEQPAREITRKFGRVGDAILLRAGPSRFAPKLFVLRPGERIAVVEARGRWLRVVLESGASAWVDARDLSR